MEPELPSDAPPDRDPSAAVSPTPAPPAEPPFEVPSLLPLWLILGAWALFWSALALWPALQQGASWSSRYDWRYFETMSELAQQFDLHPNQITTWKKEFLQGASKVFEQGGAPERQELQEKHDALYAQIGRLQVENTFLKKKVLL